MQDRTEEAEESQAAAPSAEMAPSIRPRPVVAFLGMAAILLAKVLLGHRLALGVLPTFGAACSDAVLVLAILGVTELLFWRWRFRAYLVLDLLFSIALVVLTEYVQFYQSMPAPGMLKVAGLLGSVAPSVVAFLGSAYLLYFADLPFLLVFRRRTSALVASRQPRPRGLSIAIASSLVLAAAAIAWAWDAPPGVADVVEAGSRGVIAIESVAFARAATSSSAAVGADVPDPAVKRVAGKLDYHDAVAVQKVIDATTRRGKGERIAEFPPGRYAGTNVIVVQVESLQSFAIDALFMPHLDELTHDSWYFPNSFTQAGLGTTSDAEFAMNTSLYPPSDMPACVEYVDRSIPSLPRLLAAQGYATFTMHANTARYWNRTELYPAIGFDDYYDRSFFGTDHTIGMGASDRQLVKKAVPVLVSRALNGPIYSQLVTLSPHHPFKMPRATIKLETPELLRGTTLGNYLEAMNYEDRQLGLFIDELKQYGLWDKSIVVIYGDHSGLRGSDLAKEDNMERLQVLLGRPYTVADRANIPIVIHLPDQKRGIHCETAAAQVDIMPTIADALGLDLSQTPHFGRSLFDNTRPLIVGRSGLPAGSFINEHIVCAAGRSLRSSEVQSVRQGDSDVIQLSAEDKADWRGVRTLQALSDAYVHHLPERTKKAVVAGAIIPRKLKKK